MPGGVSADPAGEGAVFDPNVLVSASVFTPRAFLDELDLGL